MNEKLTDDTPRGIDVIPFGDTRYCSVHAARLQSTRSQQQFHNAFGSGSCRGSMAASYMHASLSPCGQTQARTAPRTQRCELHTCYPSVVFWRSRSQGVDTFSRVVILLVLHSCICCAYAQRAHRPSALLWPRFHIATLIFTERQGGTTPEVPPFCWSLANPLIEPNSSFALLHKQRGHYSALWAGGADGR
jgi:hypothetical protein